MYVKCPYCNSTDYSFGMFLHGAYNCRCNKCGKFFGTVISEQSITYLADDISSAINKLAEINDNGNN